MKKLFYVLFLLPFITSACSNDDDPEEFTRDVDYEITAQIYEFGTPPASKITVHAGADWTIEGYSYDPIKSFHESDGTLYIDFGDLRYTKWYDWCGTPTRSTSDYMTMPDYIDFSNDVTKIVMSRKGVKDTYDIERSEGLIKVIPQQTSFSHFFEEEYLTRIQNSFGILFAGNLELIDEFIQFISPSVSVTVYEYDPEIRSLWSMLNPVNKAKVYRYENAADYERIVTLFKEFSKEKKSQNLKNFYGVIENWTGDYLTSDRI